MNSRETLLKFISEQGYKRNSPDKNRPFNIIPSNNITMQGVDFPVLGISNTGHMQKMYPGIDYEFEGESVFEIPMKKQFGGDMKFWRPVLQEGGLLSKTITCQNCGWSWKAADGGNDVSTCHKCGANNKIMQQGGYTTGNKVSYGTPEYAEAYNKGEVITDKGVRSPIALDEVVIQNNYRRPRGFWEQYRDKIVEENKDAGPLGAMLGTPVSAVFSLPQLAATKLFSGNWNNDQYRMERPSEAMDIENPYLAIGTDVVLDPTNLMGAGLLTKEKALQKLTNLRNVNAEGKIFNALNNELNNMAIKNTEKYMAKRAASDAPLPKELDPYLSRYSKPISREEEVFRNAMGPEYRIQKEAEDIVHLDTDGNIISAPENKPLNIDYNREFNTTDYPVREQGFTWSMNPLSWILGKKLPEGWHRKMGSAKGMQSMLDKKAIVSPSNDHLFFAYGNKPNENYPGVFNAVIDKSKLADSEISGFSRFSGPRGRHQGVSPVTSKGKSLVNIPITDPALSVHRRIPFTNSYFPIPKEAIINGPRTLKETLLVDPTLANMQKYGEDATKIALWSSSIQQAGHMGAGSNDKDKYPLGVPILQRAYEASKAYVQPQLEKTADEFQKLLNSTQYKNGGLTKYQTAGNVKEETYVIPESNLQEVIIQGKPLTEFGKTRKQIAEKNSWEQFANERFLGNFEKNMGQTLENLPEYRKQEYEDYIDKLAFDEYVKTHPKAKGEKRGEYIDRIQNINANSSNFERAYEANAAYNDATDMNKWRKFFVGMGSIVVPKPAMDYMKQHSDYYSTKEKQSMRDNPISTQVGDVVGTLEPLTIPVEALHGNKSFGQIASGESADIPTATRILGDPLMPVFEAAPLIGAGFKTVGRALGTEEGLLSNAYKYNPWAFKPNPEAYYRVLGKEGINDALKSGVIRANPKNIHPFSGEPIYDRPYFSKGTPFDRDWKTPFKNKKGKQVVGSIYPDENMVEVFGHNKFYPTNDLVTSPSVTLTPFDEGVNLYKRHWLQGYKPLTTEESALAKLGALRETSAPVQNVVQEAAIVKPWQMEELPGLHLQSTMSDGPISKIVEPKTGLINTEQALAIIGKESGGADKVALIKQALGENIPKKIDYNNFRKLIQDQLIPLERQFATDRSNYGIGSLGYPSPKRSSFETALSNIDNDITNLNKQIEITSSPIKKHYGQGLNGEHVYSYTDKYGIQYYPTEAGAIAGQERSLADLNKSLNNAISNRANNLSKMQELPLENQTLILGNKNKFGKGSSAHGNPDETLGHAHYLIDAETPDIINLTQLQSDALQGTHRIMPKTFDPEKAKYTMQRMAEIQEKNIATLSKMKAEGAADHEIKQMQEIVDAQELQNVLQKGHVENFTQKSLLDKDHQSRFLQEFVNYAAQKGNINKVRVPTSETAANVQGYMSISHDSVRPNTKKLFDNFSSFDEFLKAKYDEIGGHYLNKEELKSLEKTFNDYKTGTLKPIYEPEHQTILKKYSEQPKLIKKLFGQDAKIVTDSKGNTWYEFDIPEAFKQGKGEIRAFKQGGTMNNNLTSTQLAILIKQQADKYITKN